MKDSSRLQLVRWLAVLVVGTTLSATGLILPERGPLHFVLMGTGVLLELIACVRILIIVRSEGGGSKPS